MVCFSISVFKTQKEQSLEFPHFAMALVQNAETQKRSPLSRETIMCYTEAYCM